MPPERPLKLNSLRVNANQLPDMIYQEYSHCEVPAGCGGVVIRWRARNAGLPAQLRAEPGRNETFLDGKAIFQGFAFDITYGRHVLLIQLNELAADSAFLFAAKCFFGEGEPFAALHPEFCLVTKAGAGWSYLPEQELQPDFHRIEYDASGWKEMVPRPLPPLLQDTSIDKSLYEYREKLRKEAEALGAEPLGIDETASAIIVRKEFTLTPEGFE